MKSKLIATIALLLYSFTARPEIPEWYKRDIEGHILKASSVILYKVEKVTLESKSNEGPYHLYRIDTETLDEIKGTAPEGKCYKIQTEGEWKSPYKTGDQAIVILMRNYEGECGAIEPGFGAPGTEENIELFKSFINKGT